MKSQPCLRWLQASKNAMTNGSSSLQRVSGKELFTGEIQNRHESVQTADMYITEPRRLKYVRSVHIRKNSSRFIQKTIKKKRRQKAAADYDVLPRLLS